MAYTLWGKPVERWDLFDIADDLEDFIASLPGDSWFTTDLRSISNRIWEASKLTAISAALLREYRYQIEVYCEKLSEKA